MTRTGGIAPRDSGGGGGGGGGRTGGGTQADQPPIQLDGASGTRFGGSGGTGASFEPAPSYFESPQASAPSRPSSASFRPAIEQSEAGGGGVGSGGGTNPLQGGSLGGLQGSDVEEVLKATRKGKKAKSRSKRASE